MVQRRNPHTYAQALMEVAADPWLKGLRLANRRIHEQNLTAFLDDPGVSQADKKERLRPILSDVTPPVAAFLQTLVGEGDTHQLDSIINEFETLMARRSRYLLAHVRSAVALTADERRQLEQQLARRFGDEIAVEYEVDPSLIGGVVVRVGDQVIDGSLAGKLAVLREQLGG